MEKSKVTLTWNDDDTKEGWDVIHDLQMSGENLNEHSLMHVLMQVLISQCEDEGTPLGIFIAHHLAAMSDVSLNVYSKKEDIERPRDNNI